MKKPKKIQANPGTSGNEYSFPGNALTSKTLRQSQEQLQKIMDQSLDVICTINEEGRFVQLSAASLSTWGYAPSQLAGTECIALVHKEDKEKTTLAFLSVMKGSKTNHFENRCHRRNGEVIYIEWSARWDQEDMLMYCVARDITAVIKAEKKMREERMFLRSLIDILPVNVYTKDLQSRKTLSNRTDYEYAGFTSEADVLGKTDFELFSGESALHAVQEDQLVFTTGQAILGKEKLSIKKDGSKRWLLVSKIPLRNDDNEVTGLMGVSFDITERKEAEEKIRSAKERYDIVVKATNEAVWDWDIKTGRVYWEQGFRTLFGFNPQKDLTTIEEWMIHICPEDREPVTKSIIAAVRHPGVIQWEEQYQFIKADGSTCHVIDRGFIIRDTNGQAVRMIGAMQDVTERIVADCALRDSEEKRRLIMNAALDAIVCMDMQGRITFWNPQAEKIFGWTPGEAEGKLLSETIIPDAYRYRHDAGLQHYRETGESRVLNVLLELSAIDKNGKEFPIELTVLPIKQEKEEFFCAFIRDITQQKEAKEQLRISKERYDLVTRATNDVIYEWDIVNNVNYWGEGYETLFGHQRTGDQMPVNTWTDNLHPDEKEGLMNAVRHAFAHRIGSLTREMKFRCADGSYKTVFDNLVILYNEEGAPLRVIGAMQDITERKRNETFVIELNAKLNKRAAELAASNAELEQFAYVASHDLQEPLRMISSFLQLLQKKYNTQLDNTAQEYIGQAVSGAERMKRLIMDLLEYSRVGTNRDNRVPTDMNQVLQQVLQIFSGKIKETNAVITMPELPVISANKMQITQLFQNLLGNAFKYNTSRQPTIEIGYEEKPDAWQFFIKDNGIGIDPKFFGKIFIIFQRLHNRNQFSGTGVGLAICKKIVEKHGGTIWIESSVGNGSTFFFTIRK